MRSLLLELLYLLAQSFSYRRKIKKISKLQFDKEESTMNIEIFPLDKVVFDKVSICFGMEKSAVETAIGKGQQIGNRYYYFNNEMAMDYRENKVEFIEFLGGVEGVLKPIIYGISAFDANAGELVEILKASSNGENCDTERGYCYQFSNISVGVYREAVPEEISEMIKESASFGNPMSSEEIENESKRANHFATIGAGATGYYQR